jgi:hypothetical protein
MCQNEIVRYLEKRRGKPVSIIELMAVIPANRAAISRSCKRLVDFKEIKVRKIRQGSALKYLFSI